MVACHFPLCLQEEKTQTYFLTALYSSLGIILQLVFQHVLFT